MSFERKKLEQLFQQLGNELLRPATLCLFGSAPSILLGQPERKTQDIDVWQPSSSFDAGDLSRACAKIGVLYDPTGEVDPDVVYVQIVRPGVVALPRDFETEVLARYGKLTVVIPAPTILTAAKLVRGHERDLGDIAWWVLHRRLQMREIAEVINRFPDPRHREAARENLVFVQLICGKD